MLNKCFIVCPKPVAYENKDKTTYSQVAGVVRTWKEFIKEAGFKVVLAFAEDSVADEFFSEDITHYVSAVGANDARYFRAKLKDSKEIYNERCKRQVNAEYIRLAESRYKITKASDCRDALEYDGMRMATFRSRLRFAANEHLKNVDVIIYFDAGKTNSFCSVDCERVIGDGRTIMQVDFLTGVSTCTLGGIGFTAEDLCNILKEANNGNDA